MLRQRTSVMRTGLLIAAAAASVVFAAPPAQAAPGGDAVVAQRTFTVANGARGAATAPCPQGTRVVSGGVGTVARSPFGSAVQASGPVDSTGRTASTADGDVARRWYASVANGRGGAQSFRVFALCSATSDAIVASTTFTPQSDSRDGGAVAKCPAGRRAVGGGLGTTAASPDSIMQVSGPLDETGTTANTTAGDVARSWFANVRHSVHRTFKVFAMCSASSDAVLAETSSAVAPSAPPTFSLFGVRLPCPAGRRAVGGGVGTTAAIVDSNLQASGPRDESGFTLSTVDGDVPRFWGANIANYGIERLYKFFALCASEGA